MMILKQLQKNALRDLNILRMSITLAEYHVFRVGILGLHSKQVCNDIAEQVNKHVSNNR